jgi:hypothetical protein
MADERNSTAENGGSKTPASWVERESQPMSLAWIRFLTLYHFALSLLLLYLLTKVWPHKIPVDEAGKHTLLLFGSTFEITYEMQVLLLVMLAGALGSFVHGASSLVNFVGSRKVVASWRWWYLLRPFIGSTLALGFYFAVRAGFFATSAGTGTLNTVGFAATAFLVGMFTRQASEKLAELFNTMFRVQEKDQVVKEDKLTDAGEENKKDKK